jgi:hypothetical protein
LQIALTIWQPYPDMLGMANALKKEKGVAKRGERKLNGSLQPYAAHSFEIGSTVWG